MAQDRRRTVRVVLMVVLATLSLVVLAAVIGYVVFSDQVRTTIRTAVTSYINERMEAAVGQASEGKAQIAIGSFDYSFFTQRLTISDVRVTLIDSTVERGSTVRIHVPAINVSGLSPVDVIDGGGLSLGDIGVVDPTLSYRVWGDSTKEERSKASLGLRTEEADTAEFALPHIPNIDSLLNRLATDILPTGIAPLMIDDVDLAYLSAELIDDRPWVNGVARFDSVSLHIDDINIGQTTDVGAHLLSNIHVGLGRFTRTVHGHKNYEAENVQVQVNISDSLLLVGRVRISPPLGMGSYVQGLKFSFAQRTVSIDSFEHRPVLDDASFFRQMAFRGDRIMLSGNNVSLQDIDLEALTLGRALHVGTARIGSAAVDILSTKRAPEAPYTDPPRMPYQVFREIPFDLRVDSVVMEEGVIRYGELHYNSKAPAQVEFDRMHIRITGLTNDPVVQRQIPLELNATGRFVGQADMWARITMPLDVDRYTMSAEGGLTRLDIPRLNGFLTVAESVKLASGFATKARFRFSVNGRQASGFVDPYYTDLSVKMLDRRTKETDFINGIVSWVANAFVVRGDNEAGDGHYIGKISYTLPRDAALMQTLWFPLRDGLGDAAGF